MIERKTIEQLIANSFMELASSTPADKITIQQITDNCGMSKRTFYNHFVDKYDLIAWIYTQQFRKIFEEELAGGDYMSMMVRSMEHNSTHAGYLLNVIENTHGRDSALRAFTERTIDVYVDFLTKRYGEKIIGERLLFELRFACTATWDAIIIWLQNERAQPAETLASWLVESLPENLKRLLIA